jgi:tripartite-type tricarboxylate transporter receptor subunit TctC
MPAFFFSNLRLLALVFTGLLAASTHAQSYPKAAVRVIVPFPPGGGVDSAGRILAQKLTDSFGQSFFIDNRGGANGNIGTEQAAKSPNDGMTLLFTGAGLITNPSLYKKTPYDPFKDFAPISLMALGPNVLVVHPSLQVHSVKDLIALAQAKPGQIGFAGSGSGSTPHLAGELFNLMANVQMMHIPYRGSGPAMIGLLAGDAPVMFLPAINAGPHIASGRLRGIAVTGAQRLESLPDLPTVAASGVPGFESSQWYALLAPAGTPVDILNLLNDRVQKIMKTPEMRERMKNDGLVPAAGTREQLANHMRLETDQWSKIIKASNATID